ncbi:MAG: hypothetical protein CMK59_14765 [Proteobacteria bacterium]|nr:hypothetical protein [Pseudomonadota bacterium]
MTLNREKLIPLLGDFTIAFLLCFPVFLSKNAILGSEKVDVWNHIWGSWWWSVYLGKGEFPWETKYLLWPEGGVLWFIDPILAFLGAPLAVFSPILAYNLILFLYVAFASFAARTFAQAIGAAPQASWLASIAFALSPWMIGELHNGISEAANIGPAAIALAWTEWAAQKTSRRSSDAWKWWILAGLGIGLCFTASPYLGLGVSFAALIRGFPAIRLAWIGAAVAITTSLPTILALKSQLEHSAAIIKKPDTMNATLALHNAVDPRIFVTPFGFQSRDLSSEGFYHSMYFGLIVLAFAFSVIRQRKLWGCAAGVAIILSLGPYLYWGDEWLILGNSRIRLPWWYVQQQGLAITHPLRLAVPALAIFSALAALGASKIRWLDKTALIGLLIATDALLLSGAPWPIETANGNIPSVYKDIKQDAAKRGVLDLPTDSGYTMSASRYLYYQTYHGKPIPYAPDVRASTSSLLRINGFRRLAAMSNRRPDENKALGLSGAMLGESDFDTLRDGKIGWIVLHKDVDPSVYNKLYSALTQELGDGTSSGRATVWKLTGRGKAMPIKGNPGTQKKNIDPRAK